jgi:hypothetical protein
LPAVLGFPLIRARIGVAKPQSLKAAKGSGPNNGAYNSMEDVKMTLLDE